MKFIKKISFIFIALILTSCLSLDTEKEPTSSGLRYLLKWAELEDDIFSWQGQTKSALVKSWGIPTYTMDLGDGEEQFEYYLSESVQTTVGSESSVSKYNEYTDRSYTDTVRTETTSTSTTQSVVTFNITNNTIGDISYSGHYSQLKQLCKGRGDGSHYTEPYAYLKKHNEKGDNPTFEDFDSEELFDFLLPFSKNYHDINLSKELYLYYHNFYSDLLKEDPSQKTARNSLCWDEDNLNKIGIESFLARVMVYRETFENETFDIETAFVDEETRNKRIQEKILADYREENKEEIEKANQKVLDDIAREKEERFAKASQLCKYTLDDFSSKRVKWNEVPLDDIIALKNYSSPVMTEYFNTHDYNEDIKGFTDGKSEADYISAINSIFDSGLNESTVTMWVMWIEYYYKQFPKRLPK